MAWRVHVHGSYANMEFVMFSTPPTLVPFTSVESPADAPDTTRAPAPEEATDAGQEEPALFHMAIDRPAPDDALFYFLIGAALVVAAFVVGSALLPWPWGF